MAYLIRKDKDTLFLIDYLPRNGLYYRTFTNNPNPRTISIAPNSLDEYTVAIDAHQELHIIYKNTKQQIVHVTPLSPNIQGNVLLDDRKEQYQICNLYACFMEKELHLFYNALHPETEESELIHHCTSSSHQMVPHSLGIIPKLGTSYSCIVFQEKLYLLSIFQEEQHYSLQLYAYDSYSHKWQTPISLVQSAFPLIHCHLCLHPSGQLHLLYVQEKYGQYQLYTCKGMNESPKLLYSCAYSIKPFFIYYRQGLWIHWLEQNTGKMVLSLDESETFSSPKKTSLQTSSPILFHYIYPFDQSNQILSCRQLYGTLSPYPTCCILSQLDMDQLHPYIPPNEELKLYLSQSVSFSSQKTTEENEILEQLKKENDELKEMQESITAQYNELYHFAKQVQQEGRKWRERYYQLQQKEQIMLKKEKLKKELPNELNESDIISTDQILESKETPEKDENI